MIGAHMARKAAKAEPTARMLRAVRMAETSAIEELHLRIRRGEIQAPGVLDPGTGQTNQKRTNSPIARLINSGKIGSIELQSVEDISMAYGAMCSALWIKPISMEKMDRSSTTQEHARICDAVTRYKLWSNAWSIRAKRGDPSHAITVGAVWDEWSFEYLDDYYRLRTGTAAKATAAALRDYAARAGWAPGAAGRNWLVSEGCIFRLRAA